MSQNLFLYSSLMSLCEKCWKFAHGQAISLPHPLASNSIERVGQAGSLPDGLFTQTLTVAAQLQSRVSLVGRTARCARVRVDPLFAIVASLSYPRRPARRPAADRAVAPQALGH